MKNHWVDRTMGPDGFGEPRRRFPYLACRLLPKTFGDAIAEEDLFTGPACGILPKPEGAAGSSHGIPEFCQPGDSASGILAYIVFIFILSSIILFRLAVHHLEVALPLLIIVLSLLYHSNFAILETLGDMFL